MDSYDLDVTERPFEPAAMALSLSPLSERIRVVLQNFSQCPYLRVEGEAVPRFCIFRCIRKSAF